MFLHIAIYIFWQCEGWFYIESLNNSMHKFLLSGVKLNNNVLKISTRYKQGLNSIGKETEQ